VDVGVIVIATGIVEVIATVDDSAPRQVNGRITIRVGFTFRCTATVTDPITSTSTPTERRRDLRPRR